MKLLAILILCTVCITVFSKRLKSSSNLKLSWSNCGSASDPLKISQLTVDPSSVSIPGIITVSAEVEVAHNISSPVKAAVILKKKSFLGWIDIPCVDSIGSCEYDDLCELSPYRNVCPAPFKKYNIPCSCPVKEGVYSIKQFQFPLPKIGPHWLEHGKYKARISISSNSGQLACYEFQCDLK